MNINLSWVEQSTIVLVICPTELVVEPEPTVCSLARQAGKGLYSKAKSHPVDRSSGYTGNRRAIGTTLWIHWHTTNDRTQISLNFLDTDTQSFASCATSSLSRTVTAHTSVLIGLARQCHRLPIWHSKSLMHSFLYEVESNICWPRISCNQGIGINGSYSF